MNFLKKLISSNSSKRRIKEETTETKKCKRCLIRIKAIHNVCPRCRSADFVYDA